MGRNGGGAGKARITLKEMEDSGYTNGLENRTKLYKQSYVWRYFVELEHGMEIEKQLLQESESPMRTGRGRMWLFIKLATFSQGDGWVPWIEVKPSLLENERMGVFTLREFQKHEVVGWIGIDDKEFDEITERPSALGMGMMYIRNPIPKDGSGKGTNVWRKVNCVLDKRGCVYTTKGIHKGQELYADLHTLVDNSA